MMTSFRYSVRPSWVEEQKAIKNDKEIAGLRNAYLRDGAAYVRWLAWLEYKMSQGYDITEYEAAFRLTEYRRKNKYYMGLAYENISASGPNAGEFVSRIRTLDATRGRALTGLSCWQHCRTMCRTKRRRG